MFLTDAGLPEVDFKSKDIYQYKFGGNKAYYSRKKLTPG